MQLCLLNEHTRLASKMTRMVQSVLITASSACVNCTNACWGVESLEDMVFMV